MASIGAMLVAAATVYSTYQSNKQAKKAEKRQDAYQRAILEQEKQTAAEEKRIALESRERDKQYAASLVTGNTLLNNNITGNYSDEVLGGSLLTTNLTSGTNTNDIFA